MSWWDKLWTAWSCNYNNYLILIKIIYVIYIFIITAVDECQKYYEAMMENSFLQVTPAQALSKMIATCVVTPVGLIGHAVGDFVHNATSKYYT